MQNISHQDYTISPTVTAMAAELAVVHAACFASEAWSAEMLHGSLELSSSQGWTAYSASVPIGFILVQVTGEEADILTVGVMPEHQRHGIGRALVGRLVEELTAQGVIDIHLDVAADNIAARSLYERSGFAPVRVRRGYYHRAGEDAGIDGISYVRSGV